MERNSERDEGSTFVLEHVGGAVQGILVLASFVTHYPNLATGKSVSES